MTQDADTDAAVEDSPKRRRRLLSNMSVATRLSLVALLVTLLSLAVTAVVGLQRGSQLADEITRDRLQSAAAARSSTVDVYLGSLARDVGALATGPVTADLITSMGDAYDALSNDPPTSAETDALTEYYLAEVVPALAAVRGDLTAAGQLIPRQPAAIKLQGLYTVPDEPEEGEPPITPSLVVDPGDGSDYSAIHADMHPVYAGMAARAGYDDLFLIDARGQTIVYSVQKRTDFATSLEVGPLSGSSLSSLIDRVAADPDGPAAMIDFAPYAPVGDEPRLFIADAVRGPDGEVVGYLAIAQSIEPFDLIMSGKGEWQGFGETGDAYLVGPDGTLRTTARAYVDFPAAFTRAPDEPVPGDLTPAQRRRIARTGTTALVQPIDQASIDEAADADDVIETTNYRGVEVVAATWPVIVGDLGWTTVVEVAVGEIDRPIEDYARNMLFAIALFVVVVTFVAVRWSERIIAPIRAIASRLRAARSGSATTDVEAVLPPKSPTEYVDLATNIDLMLERLVERRAAVDQRAAERAEIVAEFLPAAAAQRTAIGDDVLDHVPSATVAALMIGGIGELVRESDEQEVRDLLAVLVDELDDLAAEYGLERAKIAGTTYYAVCGVGRPYLDHAPRTVSFALAAVDLVRDLGSEHGVDVVLRTGVDSGHISVGVSGRGGLVYDAWGEAVSRATELGRMSAGGAVVVSEAVRRQLPDDFAFAGSDSGEGIAIVTGRVGRPVGRR